MSTRSGPKSRRRGWLTIVLALLVWSGYAVSTGWAAAPADEPAPLPDSLTLALAVEWALQNNPDLLVFREQHGIAAAAVVIADTYPFNPILESKIRAAEGPTSALITNRVSNEHKLLLEVEIFHQGRYRRAGAAAALSRTDWEIAVQEVGIAVHTVRAFETLLYRQEKLRLLEQFVQLNDEAAKQVAQLVEQAQLRAGDLILARTEVEDARSQLGTARASLVVARNELRRLLGVVDGVAQAEGTLEIPLPPSENRELVLSALEHRPELRARMAAVSEAEAQVQLAQANRYGNAVVGPAYEYDPTRISLIGGQIALPLPIFNRHRGEIMQREAERARALQDLRQTETHIRQDVEAALQRLAQAQTWAEGYRSQTLPALRNALKEMDSLFAQNQPGTDVLRVIDVRRKLLKAQDGYLDALWELSQSRADLAAALGDPLFTIRACATDAPGAAPAK